MAAAVFQPKPSQTNNDVSVYSGLLCDAAILQSGFWDSPVEQRGSPPPLPLYLNLSQFAPQYRERQREASLTAAFIFYSCLLAQNPTYPAMRCLLAGFPSTVPVGMEMLELWSHCCSISQTRLILLLRTPAMDGPQYTGLLTTDRQRLNERKPTLVLIKGKTSSGMF